MKPTAYRVGLGADSVGLRVSDRLFVIESADVACDLHTRPIL